MTRKRKLKYPPTAVVNTRPLAKINHERFCLALMTESNAMAAAIKAGYAPGCARITAARLLTKANIRARVAGLLQVSGARTIARRGDVLRRMSVRGAASIADLLDLVGGTWEEFAAAVKDHPQARAIKKVKRETVYDPKANKLVAYVSEIELFDPRESDRDLMEALGWKAPVQSQVNVNATAGVIVLPLQIDAPLGVMPPAEKPAIEGRTP
jgi:hypothetical protein